MTQTIKCDICGTVADAVKVGEEYQTLMHHYQQMALQASMYGLEPEPQKYKGWMNIYGHDLCTTCLDEYRQRSESLKAQAVAEKDEIDAQYKDALTAVLKRMKHDAGTGLVKIGAVH